MGRLSDLLLPVLTWSYHGALQHYTLQPIHQIYRDQHEPQLLRILFVKFRYSKEKETSFVTAAAIMLTAVDVGIFSWPEVTTTIWAARMLWHSSLWLAVTALISSTQLRMLEDLPHSLTDAQTLTNDQVSAMLHIVLKECKCDSSEQLGSKDVESLKPDGQNDPQDTLRRPALKQFEKCFWLTWTWQVPLMLMSQGWVCFISGYALHLLSPIITRQSWSTECTGSLFAILVGAIAAVNFALTSRVGRSATAIAMRSSRQRELVVDARSSGLKPVASAEQLKL